MPADHHRHGGHQHSRPAEDFSRAFAIGIALNAAFVVCEALAGWWSGSLALLADAGHNLSDVLALLLAWAAAWLGRWAPTPHRTYGFSRASILAALASAAMLMMALGVMVWEALARIADPPPVDGWTMLLVAAIGVVVNAATALLFRRGHGDLNIRGAYLHMLADAAVSLGVVASGMGILLTGWYPLDPLVSVAIVLAIVASVWGLLRESLNLAVDAVPKGIDPHEVQDFLAGLDGVDSVHDLHIWAMSTTRTALTVHLVRPSKSVDDAFLADLNSRLRQRFGIDHVTVQVEHGDNGFRCEQLDARTL